MPGRLTSLGVGPQAGQLADPAPFTAGSAIPAADGAGPDGVLEQTDGVGHAPRRP